jgi:hypothetical protein
MGARPVPPRAPAPPQGRGAHPGVWPFRSSPQAARIQPVASLLSAVLPALGVATNSSLARTLVQPQAIQVYVARFLEASLQQ